MPRPAKQPKVQLPTAVIVNGLPGAMGVQVSRACLARGMTLASFALVRGAAAARAAAAYPAQTGPNMPASVKVNDVEVGLQDATAADAQSKLEACVAKLRADGLNPIAIDFTHPSAVNKNADMYNALKLPFVMGTTGGDRELLVSGTKKAKNPAVIAPNMCKQIVAFQAMMKHMAETYPGSFDGG
jgi:4-hydroxy-tetrahydrodipicolinate reductase